MFHPIILIHVVGYQTTRPADNSDRDKSARKWGLVGPYVKTTWTINNYCCLIYFFNKIDGNHKDTVWHLSTVLGNVKKNPYIINQNHIFFKKLLWSHFWIEDSCWPRPNELLNTWMFGYENSMWYFRVNFVGFAVGPWFTQCSVVSSVVYGDGQSHICGGATGSHVTGKGVSHVTGSDGDHVSCPEVCSAHVQPEVAQYPP
jgi:hypothetical protein